MNQSVKKTVIKGKDNPFESTVFSPFERPEIIKYNKSSINITLNQIIFFARFIMVIYAGLRLSTNIIKFFLLLVHTKEYTKSYFSNEFFSFLCTLIELVVNVLVIMDAMNISYYSQLYNDYRARMTFPHIAKWMGLSVHVMRFCMVTVLMYSSEFDIQPFSHHAGINNTDNSAVVIMDYLFVPAMGFYILAITMNFFGRHCYLEYECSHPFIEEWESKYDYRYLKQRSLSFISSTLMILNIAIILFFIIVFLKIKLLKNHFELHFGDYFHTVIPCIMFIFLMVNILHRILKRIFNLNVFTSFIFNSWIIAYFYMQTKIEMDMNDYEQEILESVSLNMNIFYYSFLVLLIINLLLLLAFHLDTFINLFFWSLKWGMSRGSIIIFLSSISILGLVLGGAYGSYSLFQQGMYVHVKLEENFKRFIEVMKFVFQIIVGIIEGIFRAVGSLGSTVLAIFCILVFVLFEIVLPILVFIGFGVPNAAMVTKKLFEILMSTFQIIAKIREYIGLMKSIFNFTSKSEGMSALASQSSTSKLVKGGPIAIAFMAFGFFAILISITSVYFNTLERMAFYNNANYSVMLFLMAILCVFMTGIVFALETLFSLHFDLYIVIIDFYPAWGLMWAKIAFGILSAAFAIMVIVAIIGPKSGINEDDNFNPNSVVVEYTCMSCLSILCPFCVMPKKYDKNQNFFLILFNRVCCFCIDTFPEKLNDGHNSLHYLKKIYCPAFVDLNPENDKPKIINLCSNFLCCCLYTRQNQRIINPMRMCFCLPNFFELRQQVQDISDSRSAAILSMGHDSRTYDYETLHDLERAKEVEDDVMPKERKHFLLAPDSHDIPHKGSEIDTRLSTLKEVKKFFRFNGLYYLPQYLIPIILTGVIYYLGYLAITNYWLITTFKPDSIFASILSDTSTQANSGHLEESEKTGKSLCPLLDLINALKDLIIKAVFGLLKDLFPNMKDLLTFLENMIIYMTNISSRDLILPFMRLLILMPAFLLCIFLTILSCISAFIVPVTRLAIIAVVLPWLFTYMWFLAIPYILKLVMENIPFMGFLMVRKEGYFYAQDVNFMLFVVLTMLFVDHIMPPIVPKRSPIGSKDGIDDYVKFYEEEVDHPFEYDIE